jgi:hypothetical protein
MAERLDEVFASTRSQKMLIPSRESFYPTENIRAHSSRSNDWGKIPSPKVHSSCRADQYCSWSENVAELQAALHRHSTQADANEVIATAVWSWILALVCGAWLFLWLVHNFARIVSLLPH